MAVEKGVENVQNPVEKWIAVVAQHYFFAILSNFCRKTMPDSTPFDCLGGLFFVCYCTCR